MHGVGGGGNWDSYVRADPPGEGVIHGDNERFGHLADQALRDIKCRTVCLGEVHSAGVKSRKRQHLLNILTVTSPCGSAQSLAVIFGHILFLCTGHCVMMLH